jgi:cyclohexadieny/prephenate dehydrogenase
MALIFERVAIVGAGLIGASIALAARETGAAAAVSLYDANAVVRQRARELRLAEVFDDAEAAVADADLVVLAVPVLAP